MQAESAKADETASAARLCAFMAARGFDACRERHDLVAFHALARSLLPVEIASVDTLEAVQRRTMSSVYLRREARAAVGFLSLFPLSSAGETAIKSNTFDGANVRPEWVSAPSSRTRTGYVWGFGGSTRNACFAILKSLRLMRERLFPHVALYARAATAGGRSIMAPFGYRGVSDADQSLFFSAPLRVREGRTR